MKHSDKSEITPQLPIHSGFGPKSTAREAIGGRSLKGKVAIVTGGYSGVGLEAVRVLAAAGAEVIVPARSPEKAREAMRGMANVTMESLDLMDPASIEAFAGRFLASGRPLHLLINSAGIMASPLMRDRRGYEAQFATNHLGHFQLTARLWPALRQAGGARVVAVSSRAHRLGGVLLGDPNFERTEYDKWKAYAQSKTANILFAAELDRLGQSSGVRAFSVHPGLIPSTGIGRFSGGKGASRLFQGIGQSLLKQGWVLSLFINRRKKERGDAFKTIRQGAATTVWCATSPQLDGMGGVYCEDCDIAEAVPADSGKGYGVRPWATDAGHARELWRLSEELTGVKFEM